MKFLTAVPIRKKDWLIKASILDDQILIFYWNDTIMAGGFEIFYDEEMAHFYIERFLND